VRLPEGFEPPPEEAVPVGAERVLLALVADEADATAAHAEAEQGEADGLGRGADGEPVGFAGEHWVSIFLTPARDCSELMKVGTVSAPLRALDSPATCAAYAAAARSAPCSGSKSCCMDKPKLVATRSNVGTSTCSFPRQMAETVLTLRRAFTASAEREMFCLPISARIKSARYISTSPDFCK
jgi:hypothetical protein